jgi:secretion/DNA translocation related TadE-like protein
MTVATVAVLGVLVLVLVGGAAVASAVSAAHRARSAADLGALAGAAALEAGAGPREACVRADALVASNGARLTGCTASGDGSLLVVDEVPITLRLPGGGPDMATARSRAGPSP